MDENPLRCDRSIVLMCILARRGAFVLPFSQSKGSWRAGLARMCVDLEAAPLSRGKPVRLLSSLYHGCLTLLHTSYTPFGASVGRRNVNYRR
jgi:hypothetical protein